MVSESRRTESRPGSILSRTLFRHGRRRGKGLRPGLHVAFAGSGAGSRECKAEYGSTRTEDDGGPNFARTKSRRAISSRQKCSSQQAIIQTPELCTSSDECSLSHSCSYF